MRCDRLSVRCFFHTIPCIKDTISHFNNQTFYRSRVYTVCPFMSSLYFYTQSSVLKLQYHVSTTKHSIVPVFILYVLLCVRCILHTNFCTNVTISHISNQTFYRSGVYTVCFLSVHAIVHKIICTINVTIAHTNN